MKTTVDEVKLLRDLITDEQKTILDRIIRFYKDEIEILEDEARDHEWDMDNKEDEINDLENKIDYLEEKYANAIDISKIHSSYQIESLNSAIQDKLKTIGILKLTEIIEKL